MEEKIIDQSKLAEDVASKIPYEFADSFLVKLLDPIKVKKEFSKPVSDKKPTKDKNGVEAIDYDKVETEVKEVDSNFRKGVVLKLPYNYNEAENALNIKTGDIIVFKDSMAEFFDLLKDSKLVKFYNIVAIER